MKAPVVCLIALLFVLSCGRKTLNDSSFQAFNFHERQVSLDCDTPIESSGLFEGRIICLQENGNLIAFDSSLVRDRTAEQKFEGKRFTALHYLHDTIFLRKDRNMFYVGSNLTINRYLPRREFIPGTLFQDSLYQVYALSLGEFGGTIFFRDKKSGRLFSYPESIWATQVLRHNNQYYVVENLAHMHGYCGLLVIPNPNNLIEIPDCFAYHINWSSTVAGQKLIKAHISNSSNSKNVDGIYLTQLQGEGTFCPLLFQRDTCLFSVFLKDSFLLISRIMGRDFYPIKLVTRHDKHGSYFSSISHLALKGSSISIYGSGFTSWNDTIAKHSSTSTMLAVKNDSIIVAQKTWERVQSTEDFLGKSR